MKEETEIKWIVNLITEGSLVSSRFHKRGGTIDDFEEYAKASKNSMMFRAWFKGMISKGTIKFLQYSENAKNYPIKLYSIDENEMFKHLEAFEYFRKISEIVLYHKIP